jgi:type II secretory pathway component PulJ
MRNERGITLVEILGAITILSILGVIVWNVFLQVYKYSQTVVSKNLMQQEANIIITNLTRIHQIEDSYEISSVPETGGVKVDIPNKDNPEKTVTFDHDQLLIEFSYYGQVNPKQEDKNIKITITDKYPTTNKIEVETFLYRLKGGDNE